MRRRPAPLATRVLFLAGITGSILVSPARGDVVVLKDGSRVEGSLERNEDGYDVTTADGKVRKLTTAQIKSIEVKPQSTPDDAKRRSRHGRDRRHAGARVRHFVPVGGFSSDRKSLGIGA